MNKSKVGHQSVLVAIERLPSPTTTRLFTPNRKVSPLAVIVRPGGYRAVTQPDHHQTISTEPKCFAVDCHRSPWWLSSGFPARPPPGHPPSSTFIFQDGVHPVCSRSPNFAYVPPREWLRSSSNEGCVPQRVASW